MTLLIRSAFPLDLIVSPPPPRPLFTRLSPLRILYLLLVDHYLRYTLRSLTPSPAPREDSTTEIVHPSVTLETAPTPVSFLLVQDYPFYVQSDLYDRHFFVSTGQTLSPSFTPDF